jgi:site-specific DNA-methyltransferase (adenine-specific)
MSKERTGYPTQKPLALLEKIIKASSNKGDVILDPFCGCATTCVAAQQLGRKWIGIDIEEKAVEILFERLESVTGTVGENTLRMKDLFVHRKDVPVRSDVMVEEITKNTKEKLFATQKGHCNGCNGKFEVWNLEVDHVVPKSKGGGDYYENYQLLCGSCNRIKGDRPMEYLRIKITKREEMLKTKITFGGFAGEGN